MVEFRLNGRPVAYDPADTWEMLLSTLREAFALTGTKGACMEGECGSCTVLLDDEPVCACLTPVISVQDRRVETIEGLVARHVVQDIETAMLAEGAVQCGYCTPGIVVAAHAALRERLDDLDALHERLSGNLCRCTGYGSISRAIAKLAHDRRGDT